MCFSLLNLDGTLISVNCRCRVTASVASCQGAAWESATAPGRGDDLVLFGGSKGDDHLRLGASAEHAGQTAVDTPFPAWTD